MARRMQTFAVMVQEFTQSGVSASIVAAILLKLIGVKKLLLLLAGYYAHVAASNVQYKSGRKSNWFRQWDLWKQFAGYFPAKIIKTADLDPAQGPYIFGYHPHGIFVVGVIANFGTNGSNFDELFPGIDMRVAVVNPIFKLPIAREFALAAGCVSADKSTILHNLHQGTSMLIAPGGANEALRTYPGTMDILLQGRKGFVKMGVLAGASLVPVISFGENETFSQYRGSMARKVQGFFMRMMGFSIPLFHGRGVFNYSFGLLPHRVPLTSVSGEPIQCPKLPEDHPDFDAVVDDLHKRYMEGLQKLYQDHQEEYYLGEAAEWFAPQPPKREYTPLKFIDSKL